MIRTILISAFSDLEKIKHLKNKKTKNSTLFGNFLIPIPKNFPCLLDIMHRNVPIRLENISLPNYKQHGTFESRVVKNNVGWFATLTQTQTDNQSHNFAKRLLLPLYCQKLYWDNIHRAHSVPNSSKKCSVL